MTTHIKTAALAIALASGCVDAPDETSTVESDVTACHHDNPLFAVDAHPYGTSLEGWAERWWQWSFSIPLSQNPNDTAGVSPDIHQDGPVYFLPTVPAGGSNDITIPRHKAVAVILSSILNDYPCPDPTFQPAPGQSLLDFLLDGAVQADNVADLTASLDGVSLGDLAPYHFTSTKVMTFTGDLSLQALDSCITGTPQSAAIEAHFVLLKPLAPGTHTLTTHILTTGGVSHDRTRTITVP